MAGERTFEIEESTPTQESVGVTGSPTPRTFELEEEAPVPKPSAMSAFRSLTPRRIGEFAEQRVLPALEENRIVNEAERERQRTRNEAELKGVSPEMQTAVAGIGSAGNQMTFGAMPWISAAMGKGAAKVGIPGFEQFNEPSIPEIKRQIDQKQNAVNELNPGASLLGTGAGFAAGLKTTPVIAPTRGPVVSGAATGLAYGALSGAAAEGDLLDAIKGAGVGLVGGAIATPIMEKVASGLVRTFVGGRSIVDASGQLTEEAKKVARKAGLSNDEIATLTPQLVSVFEQRGLIPSAAREARFKEFGIEPKAGMVTQNPRQLSAEQRFGDYSPQVGQASQAAESMTGGQSLSLRDAVHNAVNRAESNALGMKTLVDSAYAKASTTPGAFDRSSLENVGEKIIQNWTRDANLLDFRNNPLVQRAAKKLNEDLGVFLEAGNGVRIMHRNFRAVEAARKGLNEFFADARTPTERAGVRKLIEAYDDHIEQAIMSGAFKGDQNVVNNWRAARKLFSDYQNKFGIKKSGEEAGSLLKAVIEGNKSPDDVARMMFSFAGSGDASMKQNALKAFFQLRRALGANSPEIASIKQAYIQEIMKPTEASPKGFATAAKRIDAFLNGNASDFSRRVLSANERDALKRYGNVMRISGSTTPEEIARNVNKLTNAVQTVAPIVASGASYAFANVHPILAGIIAAPFSLFGAAKAYKASDFAARSIANKPPPSGNKSIETPSFRTGLPLAVQAAPSIPEETPEPLRPARASGGKVVIDHDKEAEALINKVEEAKKAHRQDTKSLLKHDDTSIAKALSVAQKGI